MERRFTPLAIALGLALVALLARLWDVQVTQHDIWARESANLVRSFEIDPYVRGTIRDAKGRPIVRDREVYALEFVWRDFRRGHPLGQVAMLRSLAAMRPVGLDETRGVLADAALGYASLTLDELDEFARGGILDAGVDYVPEVPALDARGRRERARRDRRAARASDIAYYVHRLLGLSSKEVKALRALVREVDGAGARTFLDLAGEVTDQSTDDVARALAERVTAADERLARLAELVDWSDDDALDDLDLSEGDRLVELIESQRRAVDDDAADALFRIASGFSPTRVDGGNLARFELDWLRAALDWDSVRLAQWIESRGAGFPAEVDAWLASHVIARSKLGGDSGFPADRLISAVAHAFRDDPEAWSRRNAAPQDWRQVDDLVVLSSLRERLATGGRISDGADEGVLRFQDPALRTAGETGRDLLLALYRGTFLSAAKDRLEAERAGDADAPGPPAPEERVTEESERLAEGLVETAASGRGDWQPEEQRLVARILVDEHARLQARIARILDEAAGRDAEGAGGTEDKLSFASFALEKALETRAYVLRDRGGRSRRVGATPQLELVLLVSRYADDFAGFRVTTRSRRTPVALGPDGRTPIAEHLVGKVRHPSLVDVLRRQPSSEELGELQSKLVLPNEDRRRILELIDESYRDGEMIGGTGLEAWLDAELTGEDGYIEWQGLQDHMSANRDPIYRGARDGVDVVLTLDIDLQRAAEDVLSNPKLSEVPAKDFNNIDKEWFAHPVGAIVLARTNGDILAAASVPLQPGDTAPALSDGERLNAQERTLKRPRFQPPGSVVKPLLAAYALQNLSLDPSTGLAKCDRIGTRLGTGAAGETRPGWGAVDCATSQGHSLSFGGRALALNDALSVSCNAYFAALGETYFTGDDLRAAYGMFGFGQPTGVRFDDNGERGGLGDQFYYAPDGVLRPRPATEGSDIGAEYRQRLGNGLSHVDVNVVQVARAYAALATGALPEMSLVRRIGDTELPRRAVPLGIAEEHLAVVRQGVHDVVHSTFGSAHQGKGLNTNDLGFELAAKTGSADYHRTVAGDMRKHTWLAGWFPSSAPEFIVVVYCHDTSVTSSHSAVYVASQFLRRPEVQALLQSASAEGVPAEGGQR